MEAFYEQHDKLVSKPANLRSLGWKHTKFANMYLWR